MRAAGRQRCLREGECEVEALAETLEGQEGMRREVASGHFAVRSLVAARRTLALESADQQVDAGASVLTDSRSTAAGARRQLTTLTFKGRQEQIHEHYSPGLNSVSVHINLLTLVAGQMLQE